MFDRRRKIHALKQIVAGSLPEGRKPLHTVYCGELHEPNEEQKKEIDHYKSLGYHVIVLTMCRGCDPIIEQPENV